MSSKEHTDLHLAYWSSQDVWMAESLIEQIKNPQKEVVYNIFSILIVPVNPSNHA